VFSAAIIVAMAEVFLAFCGSAVPCCGIRAAVYLYHGLFILRVLEFTHLYNIFGGILHFKCVYPTILLLVTVKLPFTLDAPAALQRGASGIVRFLS
jgi:hypothetical protein